MKYFSKKPVLNQPPRPGSNANLPNFVVIDLGDIGNTFYHTLNQAEHLISDKNIIMQEILMALAFIENSELELSYLLLDEARNAPVIENYSVISSLLNTGNAFGILLTDTMRRLGLYSNGYLQYAFDSWNGPLLVLGKVDIIIHKQKQMCSLV